MLLASAAAVALLYTQSMPGGLWADSALGQAVQNSVRAVARSVANVRLSI